MPTKREREYYRMGFRDGQRMDLAPTAPEGGDPYSWEPITSRKKPKRKLSAWQKYIKNKRNHIKYRDGKLNLKKMGVAFRRKKRR